MVERGWPRQADGALRCPGEKCGAVHYGGVHVAKLSSGGGLTCTSSSPSQTSTLLAALICAIEQNDTQGRTSHRPHPVKRHGSDPFQTVRAPAPGDPLDDHWSDDQVSVRNCLDDRRRQYDRPLAICNRNLMNAIVTMSFQRSSRWSSHGRASAPCHR
jgi:hypothetical protein